MIMGSAEASAVGKTIVLVLCVYVLQYTLEHMPWTK